MIFKVIGAVLFLGMTLLGGTASAQTANTSSIELSLPGSQERLLIGGGLPFGLYFPLAGTLCRLVETAEEPALCAAATLADSDAAIAALEDGTLPFALVQSDWQPAQFLKSVIWRGSVSALGPIPAIAVFLPMLRCRRRVWNGMIWRKPAQNLSFPRLNACVMARRMLSL